MWRPRSRAFPNYGTRKAPAAWQCEVIRGHEIATGNFRQPPEVTGSVMARRDRSRQWGISPDLRIATGNSQVTPHDHPTFLLSLIASSC